MCSHSASHHSSNLHADGGGGGDILANQESDTDVLSSVSVRYTNSNLHDGGGTELNESVSSNNYDVDCMSVDIDLHDISYDMSTNFTDHTYSVQSPTANHTVLHAKCDVDNVHTNFSASGSSILKSLTVAQVQAFLKSQGKTYVEVVSESDGLLKIRPLGTNIKPTCYIQVPNTSKSVSELGVRTIEEPCNKMKQFQNILSQNTSDMSKLLSNFFDRNVDLTQAALSQSSIGMAAKPSPKACVDLLLHLNIPMSKLVNF